jgi:hypothetical protein
MTIRFRGLRTGSAAAANPECVHHCADIVEADLQATLTRLAAVQ